MQEVFLFFNLQEMTENTTELVEKLRTEQINTYFRQRRVDLNKFDSRWPENCYVMVKTLDYPSVLRFSSKLSTFERKLYRVNREIKKLQTSLDTNTSENEEETLDLLDKKTGETLELAAEKTNLIINICAEHFIKGFVFDETTGELREATREDIKHFDSEMINEMASAVLGNLSPKG
jgi:hypothetical protein